MSSSETTDTVPYEDELMEQEDNLLYSDTEKNDKTTAVDIKITKAESNVVESAKDKTDFFPNSNFNPGFFIGHLKEQKSLHSKSI